MLKYFGVPERPLITKNGWRGHGIV